MGLSRVKRKPVIEELQPLGRFENCERDFVYKPVHPSKSTSLCIFKLKKTIFWETEPSSSFLEVEDLDRDSKHEKEQNVKANKNCSWNSNHPRTIAETNFQILLHTALKSRSYNLGFHIVELRGDNSSKCPCNRADIVEPNPPSRDVWFWDKETRKEIPQGVKCRRDDCCEVLRRCEANSHHAIKGKVGESEEHEQDVE